MNAMQCGSRLSALLLASVCAFATSGSASAGQLFYVSKIGADSAICGRKDTPCRTLNAAIGNAVDGDTVVVEPGLYGDAEERAAAREPCAATICIRKRVHIESTHGADVTTIGGAAVRVGTAVAIYANGVVLGRPGKGFLIYSYGPDEAAVFVSDAGYVDISGNVGDADGIGFLLSAKRGPIHVYENEVLGKYRFVSGIVATAPHQGSPGYVTVDHNVVMRTMSSGIVLDGFMPHVVYKNSISENVVGIEIRNDSWVSDNAISRNQIGIQVSYSREQSGVRFLGRGAKVNHNVIMNSIQVGILFDPSSVAPSHQIHLNDIFANEIVNCGLRNESGGAVNATNNFWGSANGPGADPADEPCDVSGTTSVIPFGTKRFYTRN